MIMNFNADILKTTASEVEGEGDADDGDVDNSDS